jgi:hypothetical protein
MLVLLVNCSIWTRDSNNDYFGSHKLIVLFLIGGKGGCYSFRTFQLRLQPAAR